MTVGSELTNARTSLRLSLEEVAKRTRIREANLRKLEADKLEGLAAEVYIVGWLRSCAQVLGLDSDKLIATYQSQVEKTAPQTEAPAAPVGKRRVVTSEDVAQLPISRINVVERKAPRDRPNWSLALAAIFVGLLVVAGLAVVGRFVVGDGSSSDVVVAEQTQAETVVVDPSATGDAETGATDEGLTAAASSAPVEVVIRVAGGKSWVRVTDIENVEVFEGTMSDGEERSFSDSAALDVVIGNAGVVSIVHNGVDLGQVGDAGQVVRLSFDTNLNIG